MNKREFLKAGLLAGVAAQLPLVSNAAVEAANKSSKKKAMKNWVWINPNQKDTDDELATRYASYKASGITGIFFENDSERHFRAAKAKGLEAHRWIWTFNRAELVNEKPEWYSKNRKGESCADHPPYVQYYRWLCPSRPEVQEYLTKTVDDILAKDYIDGIHLDYVRYCDVVLPVNLWDKYKIEQTKELPEYDFCYCDVCKAKFKEEYNQDLDQIQYPEASLSWRLFRYNNITRVVNGISTVAHQHKKTNNCSRISNTRSSPPQRKAGLDKLEHGWHLPHDLPRFLQRRRELDRQCRSRGCPFPGRQVPAVCRPVFIRF
ncbi:family 10 glycosylhydrolase [Mucilaginibacter sp. UC70_90]